MTDTTSVDNCALRRESHAFEVIVYFSSSGVRLAVQQPRPEASSHYLQSARKAYNSAQRQCCNYMLSHPPHGFDVEVSGGMSAPKVELTIQPALLEKLPVLADIVGSTSVEDDIRSQAKDTELKPAKIDLPCSIWGLVSLLIFTEAKGVTLKGWLQNDAPDCDPSLPVQTLEAARYMGCDDIHAQILEWLQKILREVAHHNKQADADNLLGASVRMQQACARIWHSTQILKFLQGDSAKQVFATLSGSTGSFSAAASAASHLPQGLFAQWVASWAPVLDFQSVQLSPMQWMRLSACCAQIDTSAVTTLHLNAASVPCSPHSRPLSEFEHILLSWRQSPSRDAVCSGCGNRHHGAATKFCAGFTCDYPIGPDKVCGRSLATVYALVYDIATVLTSGTGDGGKRVLEEVRQFAATAPRTPSKCVQDHEFSKSPTLLCPGFSCPDCGRVCVTDHSRSCNLATIRTDVPTPIQFARGPLRESFADDHPDADGAGSPGSDSMHALYMMGGAASCMRNLQHLGIHRLPLTFQTISILGQILSSLECRLLKLTITTESVPGAVGFSVHEKLLVFRAIARVSSLQELYIPQWEALVGEEACDCIEPLHNMPELQAVYVTEVKHSPAFPPGLIFRTLSIEAQ